MDWNLPEGWTLVALASGAIVAFLLGMLVDAIMREDGFGPFGNAAVIAAGFLMGRFVGDDYGFPVGDLVMSSVAGLIGALAALTLLSGLKAGLNRLL